VIFDHLAPVVNAAEAVALTGDVDHTMLLLRRLSLMDYGLLVLGLPDSRFPGISRLLPRMAAVDVQWSWTGSHGYDLFQSTRDFCILLQLHFQRETGRLLQGARILDYGCGYGRILRMLPYFTDINSCYGVDPWDRSIEICREDGVLGRIAQSDYLPETLPFAPEKFDLVYAYSVFTHTSQRATLAALRAIRSRISDRGLLVITVRPIEVAERDFWKERPTFDKSAFVDAYRSTGYAYFPTAFRVVDGDDVYGDAAIDPAWFASACPYFQLVTYDRGVDHDQTVLVFRPS
jgi:SAM-dependent methyltransferase